MKKPHPLLLVVLCALGLNFLLNADGQNQEPSAEVQGLVSELKKQSVTLKANQDLMDQKMEALAEKLRLARIYASRGGR